MGEKTTTAELQNKVNALYKIEASKLSAVQNIFTTDQLKLLHQATPEQHIHRLPATAGQKAGLPFVTGGYMKHMLDRLTGGLWSFEIKEKGNASGQIWVLGRLNLYKSDGTILIFKEQFGRAGIKCRKGTSDPIDIGNDMKAAATDALKKCASELGIARDIYAANEFIEAEIIDPDDIDGDDSDTPKDVPMHEQKVDDSYKKYVYGFLMEMYPKTYDRMKFIQDITGKVSVDKMNDIEWQVVCEKLEAERLSQVAPDDNN